MGLRLLMLGLMGLLLFLNFLLWASPEQGIQELRELQLAIQQQEAINQRLNQRNRGLAAEVHNLRDELDAIEERARVELGMIGQDETFFLLLDEFPPILPTAPPVE